MLCHSDRGCRVPYHPGLFRNARLSFSFLKRGLLVEANNHPEDSHEVSCEIIYFGTLLSAAAEPSRFTTPVETDINAPLRPGSVVMAIEKVKILELRAWPAVGAQASVSLSMAAARVAMAGAMAGKTPVESVNLASLTRTALDALVARLEASTVSVPLVPT